MGGPQNQWPPAPLAARGPLCPACVWGWGSWGLSDGCSVCDLAQLLGIVTGVLLALALIGTTIIFVYRRVSQFREYLA